ncbi:MAG: MFS transporter [Solirubrobacterales bacterium]
MLAGGLGILLVELDFLALNLSLPEMAEDLGTTTTDLQWAISGYMLALAAFLVPGGRLGDIFGRKRTLLIGLVIFGLGALGAGLAPNPELVIFFRIVMGLGGAILFPLSVAIITDAFPPERTMRAIGNAYGIGAVAVAIGPIFGGALTQLIDWRAVLLVIFAIAVVCLLVVVAGVRESRDPSAPRSIDLPGLATVALGIAAITFAIDRANEWSAAATIGLVVVGFLLLGAFVARERVAKWPLVDLALFRNRPYVIVTSIATACNIGFVVNVFLVTIYLQEVEGYTPIEAGAIFGAASLTAGIAGPLSGRLGERFDVPRTMGLATLVGSVGLFIVSLRGDLGIFIVALAIVGIGYGTGWAMASVGTQTVVPPEQAGVASGVTLSIVIGLAGIGVAAASMLLESGSGSTSERIGEILMWLAIGIAIVGVGLAAWATWLDRHAGGGEPPPEPA